MMENPMQKIFRELHGSLQQAIKNEPEFIDLIKD